MEPRPPTPCFSLSLRPPPLVSLAYSSTYLVLRVYEVGEGTQLLQLVLALVGLDYGSIVLADPVESILHRGEACVRTQHAEPVTGDRRANAARKQTGLLANPLGSRQVAAPEDAKDRFTKHLWNLRWIYVLLLRTRGDLEASSRWENASV